MTRIISLDDIEGGITEDLESNEPVLITSTTSTYGHVYWDKGTGAHNDVTIFRPAPEDTDFYIVGDYAQGNYEAAIGVSLIVKAVNDDPNNPILKAPKDYEMVWSKKSGGKQPGSIWQPIPHDGYIALGSVGNYEYYDKPNIENYRCVRQDMVTASEAGILIWKDSGARTSMDVSLYAIKDDAGLFYAQPDHGEPIGNYYKLKS